MNPQLLSFLLLEINSSGRINNDSDGVLIAADVSPEFSVLRQNCNPQIRHDDH